MKSKTCAVILILAIYVASAGVAIVAFTDWVDLGIRSYVEGSND